MKKLRILTRRKKFGGMPREWRKLTDKSVVRAKIDMHFDDDPTCERFFTKGKYYLVTRKIFKLVDLYLGSSSSTPQVIDDTGDELWVDEWFKNFELIL